ncbi:MAG: CDP-alcohol phosphatidyltransferase family protein [Bacteroidota bacterium]
MSTAPMSNAPDASGGDAAGEHAPVQAGASPPRIPPPSHPGFPDLGRFWTPGNLLTLSRLVLIVPITMLVYQGGPLGWMFGLILTAIATDFFDGMVARLTGTVTEWGKVLDATADKLAAAFVTVALLTRPESAGPSLPLWFVLLVVVRDSILAIGGLLQTRRLGRFTTSLWTGKLAVTLLALTVLAALLKADPEVMDALVYGTAAVMAVSIIRYTLRFRTIMRLGPYAPLDKNGNIVRSQLPEARRRAGLG